MTWNNWYKHIDWLSTTFIIIIPILGFVSTYWVPLQLKTAIWAVICKHSASLSCLFIELHTD